MKQNELESYKRAIKLKYESEKTGFYSSLLLQPSRANLRKLCVERFKNNESADDLTTFKLFFGFEFGEGNINKLKSDTDRFRALENFLKGITDCNDIEGLNLIAILVNFTSRPFLKFAKNFSENKENQLSLIKSNDIDTVRENNTPLTVLKSKKIKIIYGILGFAGLLLLGYTAKDLAFPDKECMQWQGDHYELLNCKEVNSLNNSTPILAYDDNIKSLKKLTVTDTTTFFDGDRALIWYSKVNGVPEYFNNHGFHPITGKALKPITKYIINKYVKI